MRKINEILRVIDADTDANVSFILFLFPSTPYRIYADLTIDSKSFTISKYFSYNV